MGSKHALAPDVARLVKRQRPGPLIDLFCGMCAIGGAVAPSGRSVWGNDIQRYAAVAARCQLTARTGPLASPDLASRLTTDFVANMAALKDRFGSALNVEHKRLAAGSVEDYLAGYERWQHAANSQKVAAECRRLSQRPEFPSRLCTLTFSWGYFGLRQSIEIDSVRHAIDAARARGDLTTEQRDWAVLGLLQAASACASAPGHFAQYLRGTTATSVARIRRQRARSTWATFLQAADEHYPFGTRSWRSTNRVLCADALGIWPRLSRQKVDHAVIYADPPYSKDHYSRYYHVLETLARYDYPEANGLGRYRPDRFVTPFSLKTQAVAAFQSLFAAAASRGWTLILSYPSNGLLQDIAADLAEELLRDAFPSVHLALQRPIAHSTMGARHGSARSQVDELVWVAGGS
jgi:adenine-specific DNA-methyltransferase